MGKAAKERRKHGPQVWAKLKVKPRGLSFQFHHLMLSSELACARVFSCETSVYRKCSSSSVGFKSQYCKLSEPNQTLRGCCDVPAAKLPESPRASAFPAFSGAEPEPSHEGWPSASCLEKFSHHPTLGYKYCCYYHILPIKDSQIVTCLSLSPLSWQPTFPPF